MIYDTPGVSGGYIYKEDGLGREMWDVRWEYSGCIGIVDDIQVESTGHEEFASLAFRIGS